MAAGPWLKGLFEQPYLLSERELKMNMEERWHTERVQTGLEAQGDCVCACVCVCAHTRACVRLSVTVFVVGSFVRL